MENLATQLSIDQLKQNIDALVQQKAPREVVQSYINNYENVGGNFVLKGQAQPEIKKEPTQKETVQNELFGNGSIANEKVADVTGGKEIAQGLGQAIAMGENAKGLEQAQTQGTDIQGELIKRINEKQARGEDVSKLQAALQELGGNIQKSAQETESVLNPNELTNKKVIGDAVQLATTVGTVGGLGTAGKAVTGTAGALKGTALGVAKGAGLGAAEGAVQGAAQAAQDDTSIAKGALKGGLIGAATGGVIGGAVGGISGARKVAPITRAAKQEAKALNAVKSTEDILTKTERQEAINAGRVKVTKLGKTEYLPTDTEKQAAKILQGKLQSNPVKNVPIVKKEIASRGADAEKYLGDNKIAITAKEQADMFASRRKDAEKFMTDTELKAYDEQMKLFLKQLPGRGGFNTANFYKGLKEYESNVASNLARGKQALLDPTGTASAKLRAAKDIRKVVRDAIGTRHPEFKNKMFDLTSLYDALDNIIIKAEKTSGNIITRTAKRYPTATKVGAGLIGGEILRSTLTGGN